MSDKDQGRRSASRPGLYQDITDKIVRQIEAGTIPWVQPWAEDQSLSIPRNAATNRAYSGINILLLWEALFTRGFAANRWLTFKQALTFGGNVRKGERGTTVVYADTFTPKTSGNSAPGESDDSGRRVPFLKRFTVFNVAQCDGLPFDYTVQQKPVSQALPIPTAEALIAATGANFNRTDTKAYYHIGSDTVHTPPQESFFEPINFYRTALHELTHYAEYQFMPRQLRNRPLVGLNGLPLVGIIQPGLLVPPAGFVRRLCSTTRRKRRDRPSKTASQRQIGRTTWRSSETIYLGAAGTGLHARNGVGISTLHWQPIRAHAAAAH